MSVAERRCICRHAEHLHILEGSETICAHHGCTCKQFYLWSVDFRSPSGKVYTVPDIAKFVRDNWELFGVADAELTKCASSVYRLNKSGMYSRAEDALTKLGCRYIDSWKGWTVFTFPKTFRP
jgi:hypothetical protein